MNAVLWFLAPIIGFVVIIGGKVAGDLVNKEIQGWMPDLCLAILRKARKRLPAELRETLFDELGLEEELETILFHT